MSTVLQKPCRVSWLAQKLGLVWSGQDLEITTVSPLSSPRSGALSFQAREGTLTSEPSMAVISTRETGAKAHLKSFHPRLDFVKALQILESEVGFEKNHVVARVHPTAKVAPSSVLHDGCEIGEGSVIDNFVVIGPGVKVGSFCKIKSGAVIGEDGFGFERDLDGTPLRMLHLGSVRIGDRVEIGSLTTICRGTLSDTVIEDDVKIDDHVHVAHNCLIRRKSIVTACAELSGGVVLGEETWVAPNVSVLEKVKVGDRAFLGLGAVVLKDVEAGKTVVGNPAKVLERK